MCKLNIYNIEIVVEIFTQIRFYEQNAILFSVVTSNFFDL